MNIRGLVNINVRCAEERVNICYRVAQALELSRDGAGSGLDGYEDEALVPSYDWRPVGPSERDQYLCQQPVFSAGACALLKLSAFDFQVVKRFSRQFKGVRTTPNLLAALRRTLERYIDVSGAFEVLGVFSSDPNLYTVTRSKEKKFIGLHVDNWDGKAIAARNEARSRVCVNLGPGFRYFVFCPLPFIDECESLGFSLSQYRRATQLARTFLKRVPPPPILRVRLDPGFAYIAPTESLIHDGSTEGCPEPSDTLVCFGQFSSLPINTTASTLPAPGLRDG